MTQQEIYKKYINDVYKYSYFILKNKEQAEDVTSETFLKFFEKQSKVISPDIRPYIITIARNTIFSKYKDKSSNNINLIDTEGNVVEIEDTKFNTEKMAIDENLINLVNENLDTFDSQAKEILILKIWEELKFEEISKIVKLNVNSVKTIYYKTLENLRITLNSNKFKLNLITIPLLLASIYEAFKSTQYNIDNQVLNNILSSNLFVNNLFMNTPQVVTTTTAIAKTGLLATTGAKIGALVIGIVLVSVVGVGTYSLLINKSNKNDSQVSYPITTSSSIRSDNQLLYLSSSSLNSSTSSKSTGLEVSSTANSYIPQIPQGWSRGGSQYCSLNFGIPSQDIKDQSQDIKDPSQYIKDQFSNRVSGNPTWGFNHVQDVNTDYSLYIGLINSFSPQNDYTAALVGVTCVNNTSNLNLSQAFDQISKTIKSQNTSPTLDPIYIKQSKQIKKWGLDVIFYTVHSPVGDSDLYMTVANNIIYTISTTVQSPENKVKDAIATIFDNLEFTTNVINTYGSNWVKTQYKGSSGTLEYELDKPIDWTVNTAGLDEAYLGLQGILNGQKYSVDIGVYGGDSAQPYTSIDNWVQNDIKETVKDPNLTNYISIYKKDIGNYQIRLVEGYFTSDNSYLDKIFIIRNGKLYPNNLITFKPLDKLHYNSNLLDQFAQRFLDGFKSYNN